MVADAYDAVAQVPGRHRRRGNARRPLRVGRDQRRTSPRGPASWPSFDGEATDELDDLRATFLRKAVLAGTDLVCRPLVAGGLTPAELAALTLADVPASPELTRLRHRRADLGLPADDDAPLLRGGANSCCCSSNP